MRLKSAHDMGEGTISVTQARWMIAGFTSSLILLKLCTSNLRWHEITMLIRRYKSIPAS